MRGNSVGGEDKISLQYKVNTNLSMPLSRFLSILLSRTWSQGYVYFPIFVGMELQSARAQCVYTGGGGGGHDGKRMFFFYISSLRLTFTPIFPICPKYIKKNC